MPIIMVAGAVLFKGFQAQLEVIEILWRGSTGEGWALLGLLICVNLGGMELYRQLIRYMMKGGI